TWSVAKMQTSVAPADQRPGVAGRPKCATFPEISRILPLVAGHARSQLVSRWVYLWAVMLSVVVPFPCLWSGLQLDDYPQSLAFRDLRPPDDPDGQARIPGPTSSMAEYFNFGDGTRQPVEHSVELGIYPWWT